MTYRWLLNTIKKKSLMNKSILFLSLENIKLGILAMILFFILLELKDNKIEKFLNFYK